MRRTGLGVVSVTGASAAGLSQKHWEVPNGARTSRDVLPPVTLDMSEDAPGDLTCSCSVSICSWTSWADDETERAAKERAHVELEHPEHLQ